MEKVKSINLNALRNAEHFQFMTSFGKIVESLGVEAVITADTYTRFGAALLAEELAFNVEQGSHKSKELEELDKVRDRTWNAIYGRLQSTVLSPVDSESAAASKLLHVFDQYGDPRNQPYNQESGTLSNLTGVLASTENSQLLIGLGINAWVEQLKSQNESFIAVFNQRNAEYASSTSGDTKSARKVTDSIYVEMVESVNARLVLSQGNASLTSLVSQVNELINYNKTTVASRQGRKDKSSTIK